MDRETFLARSTKKQIADVTLADGTKVYFRKVSQGEMEIAKRKYGTETTALEGTRYIVNRCVTDVDGKRFFKDEDMAALAENDFLDIEAIGNAILKFSAAANVPNA